MTLRLLDKVRQEASAKERRLDAAFKMVDALADDEAELVYVRLERRLEARAKSKTVGEPSRKRTPKTPPTDGKRKRSKQQAAKPKYSDLAEQALKAHPEGLRTYEIGKQIGQPNPSAFGTLKLLERQGRAERHGSRATALWTLPGLKPVARIETIDAAIVHVLSKTVEPMDVRKLRDAATKLLREHTGRKPREDSVTTALTKLVSKGAIGRRGANEHGAMYVLTAEGGGTDVASTLN